MKQKNNEVKRYIFSLLRVFFIVVIALLLPRFFFTDNKSALLSHHTTQNFRLGVENFTKDFLAHIAPQKETQYRIGLITNHTGVTMQGKRNIDILLSKGFSIEKIFIPENTLSACNNTPMVDEATNIPLVFLGPDATTVSNEHSSFATLDVLLIDLQDSGINSCSYLPILIKTLQTAATQDKVVVVLDRPNILGSAMEGMVAQKEYGIPIPLRHGMTLGELAHYFNTSLLTKSARLFVVPMQNYNRSLPLNILTIVHAPLLTNIDAYCGSSFLTILQAVAPLDIGLGTDLAGACLALPDYIYFPRQKWCQLRTLLKHHGIQTQWCHYTNTIKHCSFKGVRLFVKNTEQFSPFMCAVTILQFFKDAGVKLTLGTDFDRAFGDKKVREFLEGKISRAQLETEVNRRLKNFFTKAQSSFLYKPSPCVVLLSGECV